MSLGFSLGSPLKINADELSGRVIDAQSGKGLIGVNVTVLEKALGTATNQEGYFVLTGNWAATDTVLFSHVGYVTRRVCIAELPENKVILLEQKPIMLRGVEVKGAIKKYALDVPTDVRVITQDAIRTQTPLDVGDLLRGEAALQIQSTSPVNQTISIRGSNPDQVVILYDGIPIQSTRNAIGEISWININDIAELQVIKGSQTTVFGEGGIGGVVNIEGTTRSPYWLALNGRLGEHAFKEGYGGLAKSLGNFFGRYSANYRQLKYDGATYSTPLEVKALYHNLVGGYQAGADELLLRGIEMRRNLTETNSVNETAEHRTLLSLRYRGNLGTNRGGLSQVYYRNFYTSERYFTRGEAHQPQARVITNAYRDEVSGWHSEKALQSGNWLFQLGGEYQHNNFASRTLWDFTGPSAVDSLRFIQNLRRDQLGLYNVVKYHAETGLDLLPWMDWNWSMRYDQALTKRYYLAKSVMYPQPETGHTRYQSLNYKLGIELGGGSGPQSYSFFITNGANSRFPALYDMYLNDVTVSPIYHDSTVAPERVNTTEIGLNYNRKITAAEAAFKAIAIKITFFRNDFSDKIYYKPFVYTTPVALNAGAAQISGWENNVTLEMRLPVTINLGAQVLKISAEDLFPNKPDVKYQGELILANGPFNLRLRGFYEGQEMAAVTLPGGIVKLQTMQARRDVDLSAAYKHSCKHYDIWINLAALNLFSAVDAALTQYFFDRVRLLQVNLGLGFK